MKVGVFLEFPNRQGISQAQAFEESIRYAKLAEDVGLDNIWLAEWHFAPETSVLTSPMVMAAALATATKRIRIGTAVHILPLHNPLHSAEEAATIDHLTKGRFDFGIGRSGAVQNYIGYNVPYEESNQRFWECLEIIKKAWTNDTFSYHGEYYAFENVNVIPKPLQNPFPPIRIAVSSPDSYPFSASKGLDLFVGLRGLPSTLKERIDIYRTKWAEAKHQRKPDVCLRVPLYISEDMDAALSDPKESALNFYHNTLTKLFGAHIPTMSDQENADRKGRAARVSNITYEEILDTDTAFGTPVSVTERILAFKETLGIDSIAAEINFGGMLRPEQVERSIKLLGYEVAPVLRSAGI